MRGAAVMALAVLGGACGAAQTAPPTRPAPALEVRGEVCPGWTRHEAAGRTLFALPGDATREPRGEATAYVHAETEIYYELVEEVVAGIGEAGSDRAVIEGVLAGLGDPATAGLPAGWTVVSQTTTTFEGRPAVERVIDIEGQAVRRERIVRAGNTMAIVVTMARHDGEAANAPAIRCFERSIVFAAPPTS